MKTINKTIEIKAFVDDDGKPCCAANFAYNDVCIFYRSKSYGQKETCVFANDGELLTRRDHNGVAGKGMLIPLKSCPVWGDEATAVKRCQIS